LRDAPKMASSAEHGQSDGRGRAPVRLLSTNRPFTPLESARRRRGRKAWQVGDLPRIIPEVSERSAPGGERAPSTFVRLPSIDGSTATPICPAKSGPPALVRKQFRRNSSTSCQNSSNPIAEIEDEEECELRTELFKDGAVPKVKRGEANGNEEEDVLRQCQDLLSGYKSRMPFDVISTLENVLRRDKVPKDSRLLISKLFFLVSSDDANDALLTASDVPQAYLIMLGEASVSEERETVLNSYGALKFLTHSQDLLSALLGQGLIHLLLLHLKVLCLPEEASQRLSKNVVFQATSCLRNSLNSMTARREFDVAKGRQTLNKLAVAYNASREISCNLSRIFSVLSQADEAKQMDEVLDEDEDVSDVEETVDALYVMTRQHPKSSELVVRTTFALGNIAAKNDRGRTVIAERPELINVLVNILDANADYVAGEAREAGGASLVGDVLIK